MYAVSYSRTEAGIRARNAGVIQQDKLRRQRELYEAKVATEAALRIVKQETEARQEEIRTALRDAGVPYRHTYREVERRACKLFRVTKSEIQSRRRHKEIVFARQFIAYWVCRLTDCSLPMIGRLMGGKDHTTILSGKRAYVRKRSEMGRRLREAR